ncbi:hypothetical protein ACHAWO_003227 [Cyclotella atomus]|uniref:Uncharacterized protein n=1 Tax=Cyclotella atomus TaxID=382360 RepID=A0ABD3NME3_9STRA
MRTTPPPIPIFDDKQFERAFRLKRAMINYLVGHLANNNSFWTSTIDACGKESIDPLSGMKMVCYGVSWSAFRRVHCTTISAEAFTIAMRSPTYIYAVLQMLTREEWLLCTIRSTMFLVVLDLQGLNKSLDNVLTLRGRDNLHSKN